MADSYFNRRANQLNRSHDFNDREVDLAEKLNDHLSGTMVNMARQRPDLRSEIKSILQQASTDEFRTRVPLIALDMCAKGAFAYRNGRKRGDRAIYYNQRDPSKPGAPLRQPMVRIRPPNADVLELLEGAWKAVQFDLFRDGANYEFVGRNDPRGFIEEFCRKMEGVIKRLARHEGKFLPDPHASAQLSGPNPGAPVPPPEPATVISIDYLEKAGERRLLERALDLLENQTKHRQTFHRQFILMLKPQEEARQFGLDVEQINKNREALKMFLRRRLNPKQD